MEKYLKQFVIITAVMSLHSGVFAGEADPNFTQTQKICKCFEETGSANCAPLNATNTEDANRAAGRQNTGGSGNHNVQ